MCNSTTRIELRKQVLDILQPRTMLEVGVLKGDFAELRLVKPRTKLSTSHFGCAHVSYNTKRKTKIVGYGDIPTNEPSFKNDVRAYMANNHLVALGDSHLAALKFAADLGILNVGSNYFSIVPGATAVGLRNPNSLTDAVNIFKTSLLNQPLDSHVLIHLGEVDCGFVIWWRAKKYCESVNLQFQESIDAYSQFLEEVLENGFVKLCIAGASLPTIRDGVDFNDIANKRSAISVGIQQRTELTLKYNHELNKLANQFGICYFDITDGVLDRSSNLVHDFFRNPDSRDHHLDKQKIVGIWAAKCNSFVNGLL